MVTLYDYGMVNHLPDGILMRALGQDEYYALLNNWAPESTDEQRSYKWTDANGVRVFQVLEEIVDRGLASDGFAGLTDDTIARSLFTSGRAAMYQTGSWGGSGQLEQDNFEVGYFYYPPINEESYGQVGSWLANCFVAFDRGNLEETKQVLAFIGSREGTKIYSEANTAPPGRSDIPTDELAEFLPAQIVQMVKDADSAGAPPLFESAVPPDLLNLFKRVVGEVLNDLATPEEAAQQMQDAWEEARQG
ncbi:extracellular solute-binding protein [Devosia algicola]|uniref:Extracellular solute-binding protein n=1 Tax=Devosia algicola TaxID=3026418 RepID=A0ABY7YL80_9HYPH|nr:extracellular solute-binding protein [Devosia algicola]WDR01954.1 extracellular solute-binding protein [Devosia algicola]